MDWELLAALTEDERRNLLSQTVRRRFRRGEVVFHDQDPGDTLHLIVKGHVAVRRSTPLGDEATLVILGPGDYFGELVLISADVRRNATVIALEATETLTIGRDGLNELRSRHQAIDRFLLDALTHEVRRLDTLLSEALYVPVDKRVLRRLLEVATKYGGQANGTVIPLTQEDLAGLAGTSRPSANKVLRAAEEAGLLRVGRAQIEILDLEGLGRRAR